MTTPQSAAAKQVAKKAVKSAPKKAPRSYAESAKKEIPPSKEAQDAKKRQQKRKDTIEGLAFTAAKRFSERHYRRMLIGEFLACSIIVVLDEMWKDSYDDLMGPNLKPLVGVFIVFFVLAAGTTFGTGPSKLSASFGGLVTLALLMKFVADTTTTVNGKPSNKIVDYFAGSMK